MGIPPLACLFVSSGVFGNGEKLSPDEALAERGRPLPSDESETRVRRHI
jgi:hypothetical protein